MARPRGQHGNRNYSPNVDLPQLPDLSFLNPYELRQPGNNREDTTFPGNPAAPHNHGRGNVASDTHSGSVMLPTPQSLIDPTSLNRQGITQLEALQEAERWFTGALKLLNERVRLAENSKAEYGELVGLLERLQVEKTKSFAIGHAAQEAPQAGYPCMMEVDKQHPAINEAIDVPQDTMAAPSGDQTSEDIADTDSVSSSSSVDIIVDQPWLPDTSEFSRYNPQPASNQPITGQRSVLQSPGFGADLLASLPPLRADASAFSPGTMSAQYQDEGVLEAANELERAANEALKQVRITRARWNAGGKGYERWTGTC